MNSFESIIPIIILRRERKGKEGKSKGEEKGNEKDNEMMMIMTMMMILTFT